MFSGHPKQISFKKVQIYDQFLKKYIKDIWQNLRKIWQYMVSFTRKVKFIWTFSQNLLETFSSFTELSNFSKFVFQLRLRLFISSWIFFISFKLNVYFWLWRLLNKVFLLKKSSSHKKINKSMPKEKQTILKTSLTSIKMNEQLWQRNEIGNGW